MSVEIIVKQLGKIGKSYFFVYECIIRHSGNRKFAGWNIGREFYSLGKLDIYFVLLGEDTSKENWSVYLFIGAIERKERQNLSDSNLVICAKSGQNLREISSEFCFRVFRLFLELALIFKSSNVSVDTTSEVPLENVCCNVIGKNGIPACRFYEKSVIRSKFLCNVVFMRLFWCFLSLLRTAVDFQKK